MKSSLVCNRRNSSAKSFRAPSSSRIALSVSTLQLAPALDQEAPVLGPVAGLVLERLELVLGAGERLGAQAPDGAIVGDGAEQPADMGAQLLDLLAGVLGAVEAIDALRAVLELLAELGEGLLELLELARELVIGGRRLRTPA